MIRSLVAASALFLAVPALATAQLLGSSTSSEPTSSLPPLTTVVDGAGNLVIGGTVLSPDEEGTKEELPGLGHKFELFGVMMRDTDPENSAGNSGASGGGVGGNETISATTTPSTFGLAYRNLPQGIKITALTNQIGLKYYFVAPRSCAAGNPRVTLLIDAEGDGVTDFAAHGHVNPPTHAGCLPNRWVTEDLTDELPRWEITPGGFVPGLPNVFPYYQWDVLAAAITTAFPNHKVRAGFLIDGDSCSFSPAACGKAYYDLFTLENRTLEIWQDTVKK